MRIKIHPNTYNVRTNFNPKKCWTINGIMLYGIRASQFILSVVTPVLTGYCISTDFAENSIISYALIVTVFSLLYLIPALIIALFKQRSYISGAFLISETLLGILWFCAFIAVEVEWGPVSCSSLIGPSISIYTYFHHYSRPCKCAQASIAMAGAAFITFSWSCFLLFWNIAIPFVKVRQTASLWKPLGNRDLLVHRVSGLAMAVPTSHLDDTNSGSNFSRGGSDLHNLSSDMVTEK